MYKSLMFKTNPLAEELSRYRQRQMIEGKSPVKSKRNYDKSKDKNSCYSKFINIGTKIVPKYPRSLLKRSLHQSPYEKNVGSPEYNKKCTFKIHNHSLKNDNFLNRTISPYRVDKLRLKKKNSLMQEAYNSQDFYFPKSYNINIQKHDTTRISTWYRKKQKKSTYPSNQKHNYMNGSFAYTKKSQYINTITTYNELKSTLYQSIDLGNIFYKIESKIDLSKTITMGESDRLRKDGSREVGENCLTRGNSKQVKIIYKLKNYLTSETAKKPSQIMNQFNIKNLIEKKIQNQKLYKSSKTPQLEALTSRDPFFQPNDIDTLINSLNYNDRTYQTWMPSTRKKSLVVIIDDKGNIVEYDPLKKLKQKMSPNMQMSSKIAKLREIMKEYYINEKK